MNDNIWFQIAPNLKAKQDGTDLTLVIDLAKTVGPSSSGKMMGIASTGGFTQLPVENPRGKEIKLNLYLGEKN
jgi:hypothetical protein